MLEILEPFRLQTQIWAIELRLAYKLWWLRNAIKPVFVVELDMPTTLPQRDMSTSELRAAVLRAPLKYVLLAVKSLPQG